MTFYRGGSGTTERGYCGKCRGFSDWVRFGDLSLRLLLEEVEDCCKDEDLERWSKGWVEGGRRLKLE